ncbi:MAG: helix-hairpin-helix domain-containing protein [Lachnospiraceae bacterium]|nr:helix-hairpin-helix domain-containing protein [Lachnospiraceae bacterium]
MLFLRPLSCLTVFLCLISLSCFSGCKKDRELIELSELSETGDVYDAQGNMSASETGRDNGSGNGSGSGGDNGPDTEAVKDPPATVTVYICGQIINPGVYELAQGSRIVNAVNTAGGVTGKAAIQAVNLAEPLIDGAMIYIPSVSEIETGKISGDQGGGSGSLVNINTADKAKLMTIKGIGEAKAEKIIAYREANGAFGSIEDIMRIPGIKQGMFNKIKDSICVN